MRISRTTTCFSITGLIRAGPSRTLFGSATPATTTNIASSDEYICDERTTFEGSPAFKITSRSTATLSGAGDQQGMEMNMMASGDGETTLYIEVGTGRILHAESMGMFSGGIDVPAMGMSIPLELRMTSTVRPAKK